ncbi:type II toxin-antitoxin system RelB/DinJ family antitoxin [Vibrio harveyi]|uniref:type II toxin-antitoxin system RelB/DinJ family antitoxin n=1 Tax=Vibrio harveyi TaxID=669 RepID=UPI0028A53DCD|nr:type II toxin-antitoxin system RelB/DinJ family antitoxin [Vibrio vulnificus]HDY7749363.1 type II toxin-antitoxin system RelB/DinJ family antitoxin [Vibrio vulnificus]HDY7763393.1 type II toxin-antitoxin system RelB/DinJ family antitoxin [Vibrio vulnificus]HDY7772561.1 type II toxin-antitoxin system RelB/DinJ family antitoxin [Vibrio vulnificus]
MSTKPTTTIRIDHDVKKQANEVFDNIGISMSAAINTFLKAVIREGTMPFDIKAQSLKPKSANAKLNHAFIVKKDEFYTLYEDVEKEMLNHQAQLKGKKILCNCDDPFESAFFRFFVINFNRLELAGLTSTCYASSSLAGKEYPLEGATHAYKAVVSEVSDETIIRPDGSLDLESLFSIQGNHLEHLVGDGDFRSEECINLLKEADIVATNPPFSLFRDYIDLLESHKKDFIILGNMNATTTKEIFPLFRDNKVWYGESIRSGDRKFYVPDSYPLNATGCGIDDNGRRFIRVKGVRWFTNLKSTRASRPLELTRRYNKKDYPSYENYDAIEVGRTQNIPIDYEGVMGVPITFLDKYNPEQFEIIMLANGNARTNVPSRILSEVNYKLHSEDRGGVGIIDGRRVYARVFIRRKSL